MISKSFISNLTKINNKLNKDFLGDKKERIFGRTIKTQEELGEFCNEILAYFGKQRKVKLSKIKPQENLQKEWADVVLSLLTIATELNWDIDKVLQAKIDHIKKRMEIK